MSRAELQQAVGQRTWFHSIDLGHGIVTPGIDYPTDKKMARFQIPANLSGLSVLDIGANDGGVSFECERRGAARVLAVDSASPHCAWRGDGQGGFNLARRALGSQVEARTIDVLDLAPEVVGTFDLVLFLGVLYHLRHPLLSLEKVASVAHGRLILETHVDLLEEERPSMAFYERDELNGDGSNWWGPNQACVVGMLRDVGFSRIEMVCHYPPTWRYPLVSRHTPIARAVQATKRLAAGEAPDFNRDSIPLPRMVFHAWK